MVRERTKQSGKEDIIHEMGRHVKQKNQRVHPGDMKGGLHADWLSSALSGWAITIFVNADAYRRAFGHWPFGQPPVE